MRFTAAISREGGRLVARCLDVEVASQAGSVEEAEANLKEALELYYEDRALPTDLESPIIVMVEAGG